MMNEVLARLMWLWNLWPPFVGAGIRLGGIRSDLMGLEVRLKARPWTRNPMGTQFGGSIFAMTDPFFVGIFRLHLGRDIVVWDKAASIRFKRPSRAELRAVFEITPSQLDEVREQLNVRDRLDWTTAIEVVDARGTLVAIVDKTIAFRRNRAVRTVDSAHVGPPYPGGTPK
jgi:acyl-coenzyme A thioesterase PaaI-like protein